MKTFGCLKMAIMVGAAATISILAMGAGPDDPPARTSPPEKTSYPSPTTVGWRAMRWGYRGPWLSAGSRFHLARSPAVQAELKMSKEQKEAILTGDLAKSASRSTRLLITRKRVRQGSEKANEITAEMDMLARNGERDLVKLLSREQLRRLDQIALQQAGPTVILQPAIADRLRIDEEQLAEIKAVIAQAGKESETAINSEFPQRIDMPKPVGNAFTAEQNAQAQAVWKQTKALDAIRKRFDDAAIREVSKLLTTNQKRRFNGMLGEPFDLSKLSSAHNINAYAEERKKKEAERKHDPD